MVGYTEIFKYYIQMVTTEPAHGSFVKEIILDLVCHNQHKQADTRYFGQRYGEMASLSKKSIHISPLCVSRRYKTKNDQDGMMFTMITESKILAHLHSIQATVLSAMPDGRGISLKKHMYSLSVFYELKNRNEREMFIF